MIEIQDFLRYSKQMQLLEIGESGQQKIKKARVLVIGAGGLGCPVLQNLVMAGVGHIGIVDGDVVDESNLHRQSLYTHSDVGQQKVVVAKQALQALNPEVDLSFLLNISIRILRLWSRSTKSLSIVPMLLVFGT